MELVQAKKIDRSAIEWTGPTWNPWQGCIKVSEGCKFCYMYRDKLRYGQDPSTPVRSAEATFLKPLRWQREVETGRRKGQDRLVFTCSWSDWFIKEADPWRSEAWDVIQRCPGLIFQILTKRPERIPDHLPEFWGKIKGRCWLGTSVENQQRADERIPHLLKCDVAVRFLSCEPLLGGIVFKGKDFIEAGDNWTPALSGIDWVIVGGESGPGARSMDVAWARSIVAQCNAAGVAVFVKQLGSKPVVWDVGAGDELVPDAPGYVQVGYQGKPLKDKKGGDIEEFPPDLRIRQFPDRQPMPA